MGGSPNTVTTNQSQKYTPNQPILGMGQQAGQMATTAAQAPFQMPVAPIAGFNPFQQQGFGETAAAQGMAQPYFGAGANYLQQSAQGPSEGDIAQFYNPMASNVTAQMQNIFGQQMRQTTGQATQQAGGVGADRIGVAQSNLANQQGLAAGQTYAGLYNQALQAAEQQKQMEAGAGYGLGQMGPAAQNAQLQGIQALLGAGGQQQQLAQAQLNAPYQNTLAQIAYPFQTAQYLAGITGGLAPAMGGQTQGQATTTYPQPSMLSQILGGATAGAGILGGLGQTGMFGGSPSYGGGSAFTGDAYGGSASNPLSGLTAADYGPTGFFGARGGNVDKFADGGMTGMMPHPAYKTGLLPSPESRPGSIAPPTSMPPWMQQGPSGMPFGGGMPQRGFADGGGTDYGMLAKRSEMQELGNLLPSAEAGNPLASTVLHDVGGSLPMQGGGDIPSPTFPGSSPPPIGGPTPIPSMQLQPGGGKSGPYGQFMMMQSPSMGSQSQSGGVGQAIGMAEKVLPMLAMMREGGIVNPFAAGEGYADGGSEDTDINAYNDQSQPMWKRVGLQSDPDAMPPEITAGKSQVDPNSPTLVGGPSHVGFADESPTGGFQGRPQPPTPFGGGPRPYAMSPSQAPYPDALQRDWGQNATRSPWMALVKAGAQMMQTRGPIGSVIGAGLGAGAGELESQRKELRSEEDINQKAEHLAQQAQFHLDEYTKIKPSESEHLKIERERLEQENWKPFQDMFGNTRFFNSKTGEIKEAPPHGTAPIAPSSPAVPGVPTSSLSDPKVAMLEEGTPESKAEVARVLHGASILKTETMSDDIPADVFSNPLAGKQLNEQAISDMAPAQRAIIKMMVQGKMPPVSSFALSKPFWQNMIGRAALYDPDFDLTKWGARNAALKEMTSGATAKNVVRRMNTAANHLDLLDKDQQSLDAFASGSFGPATGVINKGRAKWLEASQDPRIAAVNADANAVSTELETAFKGSNPTLEGIKAWRSNMQPGMARDEMSTVNNRFVNLIKGQLDSVSDMWERAYGVKTDPMMFMSPKARATYERLGSTQQTQPAQQSFTGRTASGPNGQKLRETADGKWIQ